MEPELTNSINKIEVLMLPESSGKGFVLHTPIGGASSSLGGVYCTSDCLKQLPIKLILQDIKR